VTSDEQKKPDHTEHGGPSTPDAEMKAQHDRQTGKKPEVEVVATQQTEGESSNTGTPETATTRW